MPYTPQHKHQSRERILASAYKLFSSRGYNNVSIDQVMADADMTRGGFYAHFHNKSELYRESIRFAAANSEIRQLKPSELDDKSWVEQLLHGYLHPKNIGDSCGCPLASLVTDVTVRDDEVRTAYTNTFKGMNDLILKYTKSYSDIDQEDMLALTAMIIGGLAIARAVDDNALAKRLLKSCREEALRLLGSQSNDEKIQLKNEKHAHTMIDV